jgi:hypothetical protein
MGALVAAHRNPAIKEFYERLLWRLWQTEEGGIGGVHA